VARTLLLCRHGQSDWNAAGRYQGRLDDAALSPLGRAQAVALAARLAPRLLTAIYTSPLQRARQTAEAVASHPLPLAEGRGEGLPVIVRSELTDVDHGQWSGLRHAEVEARWPELSRAWREEPGSVRFPGGESLMEVRARALGFLAWVRHEHAGGQLLVITHGEVLQLMLASFLDMQPNQLWRLPADHCGLSIIEDYEVPLVMAINDTCHLKG
jgi:broad specificity phosphatase PhoE